MARPRQHPAEPNADLEPPIRAAVELPADAVAARLVAARQQALLEETIQPRIDGHLLVYDGVLNELASAHGRVGETMDFGLRGHTRWTAVWELSGRCIALSRCTMSQLRAGFASETLPTLRSIHEATNLLTVLRGPGEERMLRRWLDGDHLGAQAVRSAVNRIQQPVLTQLRNAGEEVRGNQHQLTTQLYSILSQGAHNTRNGFLESVSVPLRHYAYGPHPDPVTRGVHVEYGGQLLEEVVIVVGSVLATTFLGPDFYAQTIRVLQTQIQAVGEALPLDPPTLHTMRDELA